ncbi:hypothetical protein ACFZAT_25005 [Streptomyces sp. NPDC008163]
MTTRMRCPVSFASAATVGASPSQVACASPYARNSPAIREVSC